MKREWFSYEDVNKRETIVRISKSSAKTKDDAWDLASQLFIQDYCKKKNRNMDDTKDLRGTRVCWKFLVVHSPL